MAIASKGRAYYSTAQKVEKMPVSPIDPRWDEITRCWVELENAAIEVSEDLGIKSFGGIKIGTLAEAVLNLRRARCREDAKDLMKIAIEHSSTPESKKYIAMIREMVKRIPPESVERTLARKGKK